MSLYVSETSGGRDFSLELPTENTHPAICVGLWDIGVHKTTFNGEEKVGRKVLIRWQVDEMIIDGDLANTPKFVNKRYNLSLHEKATLRKDVESWIGKIEASKDAPFDLKTLIGKACLVAVEHNKSTDSFGREKVYANVTAVTKLPKGMAPIVAEHLFLNDEKPEWVSKIIASSIGEISSAEDL